MDIVTRLKEFINHESVAITQFADNCKIARPTLSQLLNGRNKKVSDEVIKKIHEAYPHLSVLWLMFGEGTMLHEENNAISEPQNSSIFGINTNHELISEDITPRIDFENNYSENDPNSENEAQEGLKGLNSVPIDIENGGDTESMSDKPTITFNPYAKKRIVNIIVYYDDSSFESFIPGVRK